jgi:predicted  nucleic acid-binding Zn-ribbon protein
MPNLPDISEGWLALFGALLGGSGLKILEAWLNRSKVKEDSATELRNELRKEVRGLRDELRTVEDELDKWRGKYYELMDEFMKAKNDLAEALRNAQNHTSGP